jgi:hypothetical protein
VSALGLALPIVGLCYFCSESDQSSTRALPVLTESEPGL